MIPTAGNAIYNKKYCAHVDFSRLAYAAQQSGFEVLGYTTQAQFLLECGLLEGIQPEKMPEVSFYQLSQAIQRLTSPAEMGELCKVMALGCNYQGPLLGFTQGDRRHRL